MSSSDKSTTQDSKEMELRPFRPEATGALVPAEVMGPPAPEGVSGIETYESESSEPHSVIQSFTPSRAGVPATGSSALPPSSFVPLSPSVPFQHSTTFTNSTASRQLFSPTQTSNRGPPAPSSSASAGAAAVQRIARTYGKPTLASRAGSTTSRSPGRADHPAPVRLSSSPSSPDKGDAPCLSSSDDEVDPGETSLKVPKLALQVVLPASRSADKTTSHKSISMSERRPSPDPLDSLSARPSVSKSASMAHGSRKSGRVADNEAKQLAEAQERQRKRAERKAREKEQAEKAAREGRMADESERKGVERRSADSVHSLQRDKSKNVVREVGPDQEKSKSFAKEVGMEREKSKSIHQEIELVDFEEDEAVEVVENPTPPEVPTEGEKQRSRVIDDDEDDDFIPEKPSKKAKKTPVKKKAAPKPKKGAAAPSKAAAAQEKKQLAEEAPKQSDEIHLEVAKPVEKGIETAVEEEEAVQNIVEEEETVQKSPTPPVEIPPHTSPLKNITPALNAPRPRLSSVASGSAPKPGSIIQYKNKNDLSAVLAKFPGAKRSGMSKKFKIPSLHSKIGPPAKPLPPAPVKAVRKKKGDESDEESSEEESDGEGGRRKKDKNKAKGMEWYMVED
ncbi:hypothetical protein P7C73_g3800, partial [Tremellales sp. Uapishka_1]